MASDERHSWQRTQIGWAITFWAFLAIAVAVLAFDDIEPGRRAAGLGVVAALALAYLVTRPDAKLDAGRNNAVYLTVAIIAGGLACAADSNLSFLLFILYPQLWIYSSSIRRGILLAGLLTATSLSGFLTADGWTWESFSMLGPTMAFSLGFSLLMGIWVSRIIDQSRERAELIKQLEATRSELADAHHSQGVAAERERMAREIHDTLAQGFTSIIMLSQAVRAQVDDGTPAAAQLDSIEAVARENLDEARALVSAFSPVALEGATLTDAVRRLALRFGAETGVAVDVEVSDRLGGLSRDREVVLLRAAQEALTNVRRHAQARLVTVRLSTEGVQALVEVMDDGVGFTPEAPPGFGLTGMRDRARDAGGELDVASTLGRGTRVSVRVPITEVTGPASSVSEPASHPATPVSGSVVR